MFLTDKSRRQMLTGGIVNTLDSEAKLERPSLHKVRAAECTSLLQRALLGGNPFHQTRPLKACPQELWSHVSQNRPKLAANIHISSLLT
ncbi:hypothetical protein KL929_002671 [Ogataea haglerorum]|nr:hypothetical protein KL929_002671 [Ogataea haglerorum]